MFESSSRSDSLKGLFARSKLKVCTLVRSAYCTSIIAPRRRRDASDNIEGWRSPCLVVSRQDKCAEAANLSHSRARPLLGTLPLPLSH